MDENGRTCYASPSNHRLLGYAPEELVGRYGVDLAHPDDRPRLEAVFTQLRQDPDRPVTVKHRFRAADGSWRMLETTMQNRLDHSTIRGWVVHSRDVTDRDAIHAELHRTQQHLRRLQIHPHFIRNVLYTIQMQLLSDPEAAAEAIASLGELLRLSYAHVDTPLVPLEHEIRFVERYVDLYRLRFPARITATFDVPDVVRSVQVPSLLLQPLVENALRHGLLPSEGGHLTVRASRTGDRLRLAVIDDGVGLSDLSDGAEGVGLSATRMRLRQMYGDRATVHLDAAPSGGTIATIILPFRIGGR